MREKCGGCGKMIEYEGDPQTVDCTVCGMINFRLTWDMVMSVGEIATENLLQRVDPWFTDRSWVTELKGK
jgi:hypothetical protein